MVDRKNYRCVVCEKSFGKQEYLDKHKMAHTDQQPFPCQYCPRRFKWKENLIKHLNWHMERMPFKCKKTQIFCGMLIEKGFLRDFAFDAQALTVAKDFRRKPD